MGGKQVRVNTTIGRLPTVRYDGRKYLVDSGAGINLIKRGAL